MSQNLAQPWNLSTRTQIRAVELPRLTDARDQIRLLRLQSGCDDDPIACDYVVGSLSNPPRYIAISYTWGDPTPTHTTQIEGKDVKVHHNCYYALWQVRQVYSTSSDLQYFWIDALCIDQNDLQEKGLQVQEMGRILHCATRVAASLGASDGASISLGRLRNLSGYAFDVMEKRPDPAIEASRLGIDRYRAYIDMVFAQLPHEHQERILSAYDVFANRPYWSRLWIVQELYQAHKIELLCGLDKFDSEWLENFDLERRLRKDREDISTMCLALPSGYLAGIISSSVETSTSSWFGLLWQLQGYRHTLCSDPRDRIYALLSMLQQPKSLQPLDVDYEKPLLQLAMECIYYFSYTDGEFEPVSIEQIVRVTSHFFEGFNITLQDFESDTWVRFWQERGNKDVQIAQWQRSDNQSSAKVEISSSGFLTQCEGRIYFVVDCRKGRLVLQRAHYHNHLSMFQGGHWPFLDRLQELQEDEFIRIFSEDYVVGIASPNAWQGDMIVLLRIQGDTGHHTGNCHFGLIMRGTQAKRYRIVGQAFLHPSIWPCFQSYLPPSCDKCVGGKERPLGELNLVFSVPEWTLLMSRFLIAGISTLSKQLDPVTASLYDQSYATLDVFEREDVDANSARRWVTRVTSPHFRDVRSPSPPPLPPR